MKKRRDVWDRDIEQILLSEGELDETVTRMAAQIDADYRDKNLLLLCILKGSLVFMGDLMKKLTIPCEIDCMKVSSYGAAAHSSGFIQVHLDLKRSVEGADVVILEDIVDSGRTLQKLSGLLAGRGAHSVRCCTLLDKPTCRQVDFRADFVGRCIPDVFVVGYGLDYGERYRNLPYIGVLRPAVYTRA